MTDSKREEKIDSIEWTQYKQEACDKSLDAAMKDPFVKFMMDAMMKKGCPVDRSFFSCIPCGKMDGHLKYRTGGFCTIDEDGDSTIKRGKINEHDSKVVICGNHIAGDRMLVNTLCHELVHAYDHCTTYFDASDLELVACSEIRASALSRECYILEEMKRGNFTIRKQFDKCVKRRAALSVSGNPFCESKEKAEEIVNSVFDICIKDTAPFERIP